MKVISDYQKFLKKYYIEDRQKELEFLKKIKQALEQDKILQEYYYFIRSEEYVKKENTRFI